jgi:glycosyltransferase involved in cell wall biosynthesis
MKIAIVNQHFHIGGVETFLLSLIGQFKRMGHDVHVFLLEPDGTNALLPDLRVLGTVIEPFHVLRRHADRPVRHFDVMLFTNTDTFFAVLRGLSRGDFEADRVMAGTYQTRMYCLDRGPLNLHNRLVREVFAKMPVRNVIFGNDACRDEHSRLTPAMADAPVIPLIVDGEKFPRRAPRGACAPPRLVSIGRLDHFKTYNLTMLSVVRRLRDLGHDVSWDVYGTGMLQSRMTSKIAELNLGRHVRLMGNVDYRRIPEVLADAFAFIGSGLSMMEASACGVPSLPAIEYADLPQTFGFPHEIEGISFFEPSLPLPRQDIGDRLIDLLQRSPAAYEAVGDAGRAKMSGFFPAAVAAQYIEAFSTASIARPRLDAARHAIFQASAMAHRDGVKALKRLGLRRQ